jgi:hypothetical protein
VDTHAETKKACAPERGHRLSLFRRKAQAQS